MNSPIFEILSQRLVKPSTSVPPSLRNHKLCLNDQIECGYVPLTLFYPNQECDSPARTATETSQILEDNFAKTLSYYYPFAGRLRDNLYIECNDMGAYFTTARIKCKMSELKKPEYSMMKALVLPNSMMSGNDGDPSLLHAQLTYFDCEGVALAVWISHKLGDLYTALSFFRDWVAMVHQPNHVPTPQFISASLFPPIEDPALVNEISFKQIGNQAMNLLFRGPKIQELKHMVAASGVEKPSRVEVVTALLYKCALDSCRKISGSFRSSVLVHPINLRPITVPPLPKEAVGNISVGLVIPTPKQEEITLPGLVSTIRNAKVNLKNEYKEAKNNAIPSVKLAMAQMNCQSPTTDLDNIYVCTSWCGFPIYDIDFGRGKATEIYVPDQGGVKNMFILRDARNEDAIEALALLEEPEMSAFATSEELLAFASLGE